MVPLTRYHMPSLILAIVGVLIIIHGVQAVPYPGEPEYKHSIDPVSSAEIPSSESTINYSGLSPTGQRAFSETLQSADGQYVIYGKSNKPSDFTYSDFAELNDGVYYISYQGAYYKLLAYGGPSDLDTLDFAFLGGYLLIGGCLIGLSVKSLQYERPRFPVTILVAVLLLWILSSLRVYGVSSNTQLVVGVVVILVVVPTSVVWYLLGRTR